jgi:hypothetical protein
VRSLLRARRRGVSPLFIIDSHPVDVCRPVRAGKQERLGGLAQTGYCSALKRWFHGVREHPIFTPQGYIASVQQVPGNRHDVQGLYALLKSSFVGHLLGDNAYWPRAEKRDQLARQGITVMAASRSNWHFQYPPRQKAWLKRTRGRVERRIGLFDKQFHADRTLCRSERHYYARRWMKALAHNVSRHVNAAEKLPLESLAHFRLAA